MGITVSINHPAFPEGYSFGIDHLGEIPNGGSLEVPEDNEAIFLSVRGMTVEDAFAGSEVVSSSGSSSVDNPDEIIGDREPPGPEQGVVDEEQEQASEAEEAQEGEEAPSNTEDTQMMPPSEGGN